MNTTVLKVEYYMLIILYAVVSSLLAIPVLPLLYIKVVYNSVALWVTSGG